MGSDWIATLASTAANAVVSAAATDAWQFARGEIVRLFGHDHDDRDGVAQANNLLDVTASELADPNATERGRSKGRLTCEWEAWLAECLRARPNSATALDALAVELSRRVPTNPQLNVVTNIAESGGNQIISVGGTQYIGGSPQ